MATIQFKKGDEYIFKLNRLSESAKSKVIGPAIYDAAGIVADEIKKDLRNVPTDESRGTPDKPKLGPTQAQKDGLVDNIGIASEQTDRRGLVNVKIGFDGYNNVKTKMYPNGQPNQLIARSVESGSSFMKANPFVKTAAQRTRKQALDAMKKRVDEEIEKIMK